ncbi:hypothetical protein [Entomospira culicis]|uniref:Uncharacterized protein n=1 Tax=Entomospira culicis TaxID=2719989 RepID=A0A968GHR6_9SPIO|nr:hypothetical protein [Entomospira culicis]NIZ19042.1 hypothetical protein [Entomospira culicis]NIZ69257.1 hypothetical protein [Entomospira culicis]WDI37840.1 hypothetical protein PVA46_03385 [Entomospira culicis]WDI39468.1 hypothetical protein PVA47_03390 [Entomospira culicis]
MKYILPNNQVCALHKISLAKDITDFQARHHTPEYLHLVETWGAHHYLFELTGGDSYLCVTFSAESDDNLMLHITADQRVALIAIHDKLIFIDMLEKKVQVVACQWYIAGLHILDNGTFLVDCERVLYLITVEGKIIQEIPFSQRILHLAWDAQGVDVITEDEEHHRIILDDEQGRGIF